MNKIVTIVIFLSLQACTFMEVSENSGGFGYVVGANGPVQGAEVMISDLAGDLTGTTNYDGHFSIKPVIRKTFGPLMSNPVYHDVVLSISKDGYLPYTNTINKSVFGESNINFGRIELESK